MNVRAITLGVPVGDAFSETVQHSARILNEIRKAVQDAGFTVQTTRLSTPPIASFLDSANKVEAFGRQFDRVLANAGIDYGALGTVDVETALHEPAWVFAVANSVLTSDRVFASVAIGNNTGVSPQLARVAAESIVRIGNESHGGFGNLRFAVQANCLPGSPFFPTGYHDGGPTSFAFALESAGLAVEAFAAESLAEARVGLIQRLESVGSQLVEVAKEFEEAGLRFGGIDLSLAPYPDQQRSIGSALERLGLAGLGQPGSLAAVAFLADTLRAVNLPRCGFSGVMLPVLEDKVLAQRWSDGSLSVTSLLLFSTVCGTGLDTIPLPGNTSAQSIAGVLLDLGALAAVLNKPLTARLLPVPGLSSGASTVFDFEYFVNARVSDLGTGPTGSLSAAGWMPLRSNIP